MLQTDIRVKVFYYHFDQKAATTFQLHGESYAIISSFAGIECVNSLSLRYTKANAIQLNWLQSQEAVECTRASFQIEAKFSDKSLFLKIMRLLIILPSFFKTPAVVFLLGRLAFLRILGYARSQRAIAYQGSQKFSSYSECSNGKYP